MHICAITVTYNSGHVLTDFLTALQPYVTGDRGIDVDVVAVDNASTDDSVQRLEQAPFPVDVVRSTTNDGYAAGINRAIVRRPGVDAYLILNPDTRLNEGSLEALATGLGLPGVGIAVPRMIRADGSLRYTLRRAPSVGRAWAELVLTAERAARIGNLGDRVGQVEAYRTSHTVDWASGSAMLISARCIRNVGFWDESFFLYSEETDFCLRARDRGFATYFCVDAIITHLGGESRTSPELHAILTVNRIRCYRKHHGRVRTALFSTAVILKQVLRSVLGDEAARAALWALLRPSTRHPDLRRMQARASTGTSRLADG